MPVLGSGKIMGFEIFRPLFLCRMSSFQSGIDHETLIAIINKKNSKG
jgi:hypothetical protein